MKKIISVILSLMVVFSVSVSAQINEEQISEILSRLNNLEDVELVTYEAVLFMAESGILKSLEEKGETETLKSLKGMADEALNLASYEDKVKAKEKTEEFCNELKNAISVLNGNKSNKEQFVDVKQGAWYYEAVSYTVKNGIFKGMDEQHFSPDTAITRGMFLALMGRMYLDTDTSYPETYTDVKSGKYYSDAVNTAKAKGILDFIDGEYFYPDKAITREELVTILRGCMANKGINTEYATQKDFTDSNSVSKWAKDAVLWAADKEIISGFEDGSFRPKDSTTRAQAAKIFFNLK